MSSDTDSGTAVVTGAARGTAPHRRAARATGTRPVLDLDAAACGETAAAHHQERRPRAGRRRGRHVTSTGGTGGPRVAEELGPPRSSSTNAGVLRDNLLFKMTATDWDTVLGVHLKARS